MKSIEEVTNRVRVCLREAMKDSQEGQLVTSSNDFACQAVLFRITCSLLFTAARVAVGQMALFSVTMKDFSKLLTTFVDGRITNLVLATCHGPCVQ